MATGGDQHQQINKKKRSPNFTEAEKDLFVDVILPKYKDVVESKKTDHITNEAKARKWFELTNEFNSLSAIHFRTVENLQNLWDNLKKAARSASASERKENSATGGGTRNSSRDPSPRDLKVLAILGASGTGLSNIYDGDCNQLQEIQVVGVGDLDHFEEIQALDCSNISVPATSEVNWGSHVPSMLYTPKPDALQTNSRDSSPSSIKEVKKRSVEEEKEWLKACKRRRPTAVDDNQEKLLAAKLQLTISTQKELDEKAKREQALFEIEKRKKELEAEMMALQVLKLKKDLGLE